MDDIDRTFQFSCEDRGNFFTRKKKHIEQEFTLTQIIEMALQAWAADASQEIKAQKYSYQATETTPEEEEPQPESVGV